MIVIGYHFTPQEKEGKQLYRKAVHRSSGSFRMKHGIWEGHGRLSPTTWSKSQPLEQRWLEKDSNSCQGALGFLVLGIKEREAGLYQETGRVERSLKDSSGNLRRGRPLFDVTAL